MWQRIATVLVPKASFWEGFIRAFDLFGTLGPRIDLDADPRVVDREAIRSDWAKGHGDMERAFRIVDGERNSTVHQNPR